MLDRVADYYRKEQKNAVGGIKTFVEPALIVFLAVAVGFILIAVLVPMFDMYSTVM
jgi:type IV pilus assembly protein PilC